MEKIDIKFSFNPDDWPVVRDGYGNVDIEAIEGIMNLYMILYDFKKDLPFLLKEAKANRDKIQNACDCPDNKKEVFTNDKLCLEQRCSLCKKSFSKST